MSYGEIIGILIAVVAVVFLYYELHGPLVNWMLVGGGLLAAGAIKNWVVPNLSWTVGGMSIAGIITVVVFAVFYAEVIKGRGRGKWIAPASSFAFGLALVLTLSAAGQMVLPAGHTPAVISIVKHN